MHVTCQLRDPTQADQQCLREYLAPDPLANSSILDLSLSPIEKDFGEFELQDSLDSSHSGDLESLTSGAFGSSLESAAAAADDSSEVTVHPSPSLHSLPLAGDISLGLAGDISLGLLDRTEGPGS